MNAIQILSSPWAIMPAKLEEIQAIFTRHASGGTVDLATIEKQLGRPLSNQHRRYDVIDGVAVLPLEGVIAKRMNMFSEISGGVSSELVARDLRDAISDTAVHSIVLSVDSPGGTVDGTQTLMQAVRSARAHKPVVTLASGTIASAAYWIGSASEAVYLAEETTLAGSIGVVAKHVDVSGAEAQRGIRTTEITAGKYKRIASQYAPLSDEGRQSMQEQVDALYSVFVSDVATNRGVSVEKVLSRMAEGQVFIGRRAVDAGLADGIAPLSAVLAELSQRHASGGQQATSRQLPGTQPQAAALSAGASQVDIEAVAGEEWSRNPAIRAEFRNNKSAFLAYRKAEALGRVEIVRSRTVSR